MSQLKGGGEKQNTALNRVMNSGRNYLTHLSKLRKMNRKIKKGTWV